MQLEENNSLFRLDNGIAWDPLYVYVSLTSVGRSFKLAMPKCT